jgi:hypothetical protein
MSKVMRKAKGTEKVSKQRKYNKEKNINKDERTDYVDKSVGRKTGKLTIIRGHK